MVIHVTLTQFFLIVFGIVNLGGGVLYFIFEQFINKRSIIKKLPWWQKFLVCQLWLIADLCYLFLLARNKWRNHRGH